MLLLLTFIYEFFNNADAVTELSFVDVFTILSTKWFVFSVWNHKIKSFRKCFMCTIFIKTKHFSCIQ